MDGFDPPDLLFLQDGDEVLCLVPFELDAEVLGHDESSF